MDVSRLDYDLPQRLIAQQGLPNRSDSRLMVLDRKTGQIAHRLFKDILDYLHPSDCLVLNDSKVIPARFYLQRQTGGIVEGLFLRKTDDENWLVLLKHAGRLKTGELLHFYRPDQDRSDETAMIVVEKKTQGLWLLNPAIPQDAFALLDRFGRPPLPPYIHRSRKDPADETDRRRYQTVYAHSPGSVAAPTAGLHFTPELLDSVRERSIRIARVTLHVGMGTFKPVTVEKLEDHVMHFETYSIDENNASLINQTIQQSGRIFAVGTTSVRTLETIAKNRHIHAASGSTNLFITPGYAFQIVDAIITNFHLPRSTLLALVCAFAGRDQMLNAYRLAVQQEYRFFSYGDAMLIL